MSRQIAILIGVRETKLNYSNQATSGVDLMVSNISSSLSYAFPSVQLVQHNVKKERIVKTISDAARHLEPGGFCFIYFHGHGDTLPGGFDHDEFKDQALVCYDGYLFDDELDFLLRKFHRSHRVMTFMDCCSSNTVVEWKFDPRLYPQIIHIAAASDNGYAHANTQGGFMSSVFNQMVYGYGYANYSYVSFIRDLSARMSANGAPLFVRNNQNVPPSYLKMKLFT